VNVSKWFVLGALVALTFPGCRSVYVHPEATAEKFENDQARCKYNVSAAELAAIVGDESRTIPPIRRDWKKCMIAMGWDTRSRVRSSNVWSRD